MVGCVLWMGAVSRCANLQPRLCGTADEQYARKLQLADADQEMMGGPLADVRTLGRGMLD